MKSLFIGFFFFKIVTLSLPTWAGIGFDFHGYYNSGAQTATTSSESTTTYWRGSVLIDVTSDFWAGWSYGNSSFQEVTGTTDNHLVAEDMGVALQYSMGRSQSFTVYGVYNIQTKAEQKTGSVVEQLEGSSYVVGMGYTPDLGRSMSSSDRVRGFHMGLFVNYYNADYTSKILNGVKSSVAYNKNLIFPSISIFKSF